VAIRPPRSGMLLVNCGRGAAGFAAPAGELSATVRAEFGISQPAVSQHLKVLRENGFATVRVDGARRLYALDASPLREVDEWLDRYRAFWNQRLDALDTELRRSGGRSGGGKSGATLASPSRRPRSGSARTPTARSWNSSTAVCPPA
jgi:DNA-binding transcriptional ArsR family regulator